MKKKSTRGGKREKKKRSKRDEVPEGMLEDGFLPHQDCQRQIWLCKPSAKREAFKRTGTPNMGADFIQGM